eukprot:tig00001669_g9558.t1
MARAGGRQAQAKRAASAQSTSSGLGSGALLAVLLAVAAALLLVPRALKLRSSSDVDDGPYVYGSDEPIDYERGLNEEFAAAVLQSSMDELLAAAPDLSLPALEAEVEAVIEREWKNATRATPRIARAMTNRHFFDLKSYAIFKVAAEHIAGDEARLAFTERIGRRIYRLAGNAVDLSPKAGRLEEEEEPWEAPLGRLVGYLSSVGYLAEGGIDWSQWSTARWLARGKSQFRYWMKDPVILPSAKRLYSEHGFAQHYSSRTLEAFFEAFGITAREESSFDPRGYPPELVVELWNVERPVGRGPSATERYLETLSETLRAGIEAAAAAAEGATPSPPPLPLGAPPPAPA